MGVEDLSVRGMLRSRRMSRRVADAAMSRLISRTTTKVREAGGEVATAPRNYPSTRMCSGCGGRTSQIPPGLAGLRIRRWTCERCGSVHDRDVNAAKNLDPGRLRKTNDAASCAESENARGEACQATAAGRAGGLDEAGSANARNPHAGATAPGALANDGGTCDPTTSCNESVGRGEAPG